MKNIVRFIPVVAAMIVLAACSSDDMSQKKVVQKSVTAIIDGENTTRAAVSDVSVVWTDDDAIKVFNSDGSANETWTLENGSGTTTAKFSFTGEPAIATGEETYAVYPAAATTSLTSKKATMTLPEEIAFASQNVDGTDLMKTVIPMCATYGESMQFKYLTAVLKVTFNDLPVGSTEIIATSSAQKLSGTFVSTNITTAAPKLSKSGTDGTNTVKVTFAATTSTENRVVFLPLPAGTYDLKLQVKKGDDVIDVKSWATREFVRAKLYRTTVNYVEVSAATPSAVTTSLSSQVTDSNKDVELTITDTTGDGDGVKSSSSDNTITVPAIDGANINLNFTQPIAGTTDAGGALRVEDVNKDAASTDAQNKLTITQPDATNVDVEINLPKTTVSLQSSGTNTVYKSVTAKTATNTLVIGKGVTIETLTVNGGNVLIDGGTVNKLVNAADGTVINANDATTIAEFTADKDFTIRGFSSAKRITVTEMTVSGGQATLRGNLNVTALNHSSSAMLNMVYSSNQKVETLTLNEGSAGAQTYGTVSNLVVDAENTTITQQYGQISAMTVNKRIETLNINNSSSKLLSLNDGVVNYNVGTLRVASGAKVVKIASGNTIDKVVNAKSQSSGTVYLFVVKEDLSPYEGTMEGNYILTTNTTSGNVKWDSYYFPTLTAAYQFAKDVKDPADQNNKKSVELTVLNDIADEPYLCVNTSNVTLTTINLNGKNVTLLGNVPGNDNSKNGILVNAPLTVKGSGSLSSKDENSNWMFCVGSTTLTIEGDAAYNCYHVGALANGKTAKVYIKGGEWKATTTYNGNYWILNKQDSYRSTSVIEVSGGKFYLFDPADNVSEGANTNFMASGYKSTKDGDWYVVSAE